MQVVVGDILGSWEAVRGEILVGQGGISLPPDEVET